MYKTIQLSDGNPCKVQVLGLFDLDIIEPPLGPFKYSFLTATGDMYEDEYIFPDEPPKEPDKPLEECEESDYEYHQWKEYNTYQAALAYQKKRTEDYERYLREVSQYIVERCLLPDDRSRLIEPSDYQKVQLAAIVPQLTEEVLADTLRNTFQSIIW